MTRNCLDLNDFSPQTLHKLVSKAVTAKTVGQQPILKDKHLSLLFAKPSARTRLSFEAAMRYLGGTSSVIASADVGYPDREDLSDISQTIGLFCDAIVARLVEQSEIEVMADKAGVPVINGLSNCFHPCQAIADVQTIFEEVPKDQRNICWIGDINNVCLSLIQITGKLNIPMRISCPHSILPNQNLSQISGNPDHDITWIEDPKKAAVDQRVVYSDVWVSMGQDKNTKTTHLEPWQVNASVMASAHPEAIFMHCLPATRGKEVTADVIDGPQSRVWQQAQNRMYAQIAVLAWCFDCLDQLA